jgi:hypothetical protein
MSTSAVASLTVVRAPPAAAARSGRSQQVRVSPVERRVRDGGGLLERPPHGVAEHEAGLLEQRPGVLIAPGARHHDDEIGRRGEQRSPDQRSAHPSAPCARAHARWPPLVRALSDRQTSGSSGLIAGVTVSLQDEDSDRPDGLCRANWASGVGVPA